MWIPQGLVKYQCFECDKQFIVGAMDEKEKKPICCPYCQSETIDDMVNVEPDQDYSKWLEEMGCMGIYYNKEGDSD